MPDQRVRTWFHQALFPKFDIGLGNPSQQPKAMGFFPYLKPKQTVLNFGLRLRIKRVSHRHRNEPNASRRPQTNQVSGFSLTTHLLYILTCGTIVGLWPFS
jgi:hypothetical protein